MFGEVIFAEDVFTLCILLQWFKKLQTCQVFILSVDEEYFSDGWNTYITNVKFSL